MGNTVSNATEATNPTYDLKLQGGIIVLVEKSDAEYDFEEFRYKSIGEAEEALPEKTKEAIEAQIEQVNQISDEIRAKKEKIQKCLENIATLQKQDTIKDKKFHRLAKWSKGKAYHVIC